MLSVVMATRNGSRWIASCLQAFCALEAPPGGYQLIIIDNGSSDGTADIIRAFQDRLPMLALYCATPGRNRALKMALQHIAGDLVVITDDDVLPAPDWLKAFHGAASRMPEIGVFAGQVRHHWQRKPPRWLLDLAAQGRAYAGTPIDQPDGPIDASQVKGPNFMVRRALLDRFQFDEGIGPDGTRNYAAGSETSLLLAMEKAGIGFHFVSGALVQHIVRPNQISLRAMIARYFRIGRGVQRMGLKDSVNPQAKKLFGYPRYALRRIVELLVKAGLCWARRDTTAAAGKLISGAALAGAAYESRRQKPSRETPKARPC
ncbi:MAG: glycosyltransferase family 2 protein [Alphaproteobacteria bacterium]|nr:MAG: glycosyltransferase family 2 protein [Alphaproteobacteria bacterium]